MKYKFFVINLDSKPDRLEDVSKQLHQYGIEFERFSAVMGSELDQSTIEEFYDAKGNARKYYKEMSVGEIGCYLSHIQLWKRIIEENLDFAVILEDDLTVKPEIASLINAIARLKNWDYIKLAGPKGKKVIDKQPIDNTFSLAYYNKTPIGTAAQAVSKQGAQRLLKTTQPFIRPVDSDIQYYWERGIKLQGLEPQIVSTGNFPSDIKAMAKGRGREKSSKHWARIKQRISFAWNNKKANCNRPTLSHFIK